MSPACNFRQKKWYSNRLNANYNSCTLFSTNKLFLYSFFNFSSSIWFEFFIFSKQIHKWFNVLKENCIKMFWIKKSKNPWTNYFIFDSVSISITRISNTSVMYKEIITCIKITLMQINWDENNENIKYIVSICLFMKIIDLKVTIWSFLNLKKILWCHYKKYHEWKQDYFHLHLISSNCVLVAFNNPMALEIY